MTFSDVDDRFIPVCAIEKTKKSQYWIARITVPRALHSVCGKADRKKSLRTTDKKQALRLLSVMALDFAREFTDMARRAIPDEADLPFIARRVAEKTIEQHEAFRKSTAVSKVQREAEIDEIHREGYSYDDIYEVEEKLKNDTAAEFAARAAKRQKLRDDFADNRYDEAHALTAQIAKSQGWEIEGGHPIFDELKYLLMRAKLEAGRVIDANDKGVFTEKVSDPVLIKAFEKKLATVAKPGERLMDHFEVFKTQMFKSRTLQTWIKNERIIGHFADFVGRDKLVSEIRREDVKAFRKALYHWPVKATERTKEFGGMTFPMIVNRHKAMAKKFPIISDFTKNSYLAGLGDFLNWLKHERLNPDDLMDGVYIVVDKEEVRKEPFDETAIPAIFNSPLFRGCLGDGKEHLPGHVQVRDWRFWIPLIAIFTGSRLGEICQLLCADIKIEHDVPFFHFTTKGTKAADPKKRLKNKASDRIVPIHQELLNMGFLDFVERARAKGVRLFPEIRQGTDDAWSTYSSKFFNNYLKDIGVKTDRMTSFHSTRHNITDAFRNAGLEDNSFGLILGHSSKTTTSGYGGKQQGPLQARKAMIDKVSYPGLDLSGLYVMAKSEPDRSIEDTKSLLDSIDRSLEAVKAPAAPIQAAKPKSVGEQVREKFARIERRKVAERAERLAFREKWKAAREADETKIDYPKGTSAIIEANDAEKCPYRSMDENSRLLSRDAKRLTHQPEICS